jgi:deoxyribodipyrimidine photolyase-like uncharacterized protein
MPNTLGMALFGDGGIVGSKSYAASGKYIHRMSDYCNHCQYGLDVMTGDNTCPFSGLYRDFLARHEKKFDAINACLIFFQHGINSALKSNKLFVINPLLPCKK